MLSPACDLNHYAPPPTPRTDGTPFEPVSRRPPYAHLRPHLTVTRRPVPSPSPIRVQLTASRRAARPAPRLPASHPAPALIPPPHPLAAPLLLLQPFAPFCLPKHRTRACSTAPRADYAPPRPATIRNTTTPFESSQHTAEPFERLRATTATRSPSSLHHFAPPPARCSCRYARLAQARSTTAATNIHSFNPPFRASTATSPHLLNGSSSRHHCPLRVSAPSPPKFAPPPPPPSPDALVALRPLTRRQPHPMTSNELAFSTPRYAYALVCSSTLSRRRRPNHRPAIPRSVSTTTLRAAHRR